MKRPSLSVTGAPRLMPAADLALLVATIALMLGGAAMLVAGLNAGIAFPLIAIGLALVALRATKRRSRR